MQIVELGSLPDPNKLRGQCVHCRTKVNFLRSELVSSPWPNLCLKLWICPLCKATNGVYAEGHYPIPQGVSNGNS